MSNDGGGVIVGDNIDGADGNIGSVSVGPVYGFVTGGAMISGVPGSCGVLNDGGGSMIGGVAIVGAGGTVGADGTPAIGSTVPIGSSGATGPVPAGIVPSVLMPSEAGMP